MRQVVGVVRTANYASLGETPQLCVYLPLAQNFTEGVVLYVRTAAADPAPVLSTVQREIRSLDPLIQARDARTIRAGAGSGDVRRDDWRRHVERLRPARAGARELSGCMA